MRSIVGFAALGLVFAAAPAAAASFFFSTGNPDGLIATASRPGAGAKIEIETADDFVLTGTTSITGATFTGLLSNANLADVNNLAVEIYRVFPLDSDVGRTSGPPLFSTTSVPTRVNSPSDVAFDSREAPAGELTFAGSTLSPSFTAANSIINGIHPQPNQLTHGDGPVTGSEVAFSVTFTTPFLLGPGHYFFVPQVGLSTAGDFLWLSAPRPIVAPGTPFNSDLQAWIRNENLAPDWLRIGTDITGQGPFDMTFSLTGATVPEPDAWMLMLLGFAGLGGAYRQVKGRQGRGRQGVPTPT